MCPGPSAFDEFNWLLKNAGGLTRARKPEPIPSEPEEMVPEQAKPAPAHESPVKLSNPRWLSEEASIGEKVMGSVDLELPDTHAHLTRVTLSLFRIGANGKKEKETTIDVHAKGGTAQGDFILKRLAGAKPGETVPFTFTATHRDAKEVESPELAAVEPARNLICELDEHSDITKRGYTLVLKGGGGIHTTYKAEDGIEEGGILKFDFKNMDPEVAYVLELHDEKDRIVSTLFSDKKHGEWGQ